VLLKLNVKLRTPSPQLPAAAEAPWESQTPSNARELGAQSTLVREKIQRYQNFSPTSLVRSVDQLARGAEMIAHSIVLLRDQISALEKAN
jgi:hypothetical protein